MHALLLAAAVALAPRPVLVTVDDLPIASDEMHPDPAERAKITGDLLAVLAKHHIQAVAFVTWKRASKKDDGNLLAQWSAAGHELGNHTVSHLHFRDVDSKAYIADAEDGRARLAAFLKGHGRGTVRFFRFPFFEEGDTPDKVDAMRAYLAKSGQRNLFATIDDQDWSYEKPWVDARRAGDAAAMAATGEDYQAALRIEVESQESLGDDVAGHRAPQVLLLHANEVGTAQWDRLFTWLESTGHRFAGADEVLADPALAADPPRYVGAFGFGLWDRLHAVAREAKAKDDVAKLLAAQAADWSKGDIDAFCSVYAEDATFVSPSGITHGRAAVLGRYKKKYVGKEGMGTLTLEILETKAVAGTEFTALDDARPGRVQAVDVIAKWTLTWPGKPAATGSTALLLRPRSTGGWEILQDASM